MLQFIIWRSIKRARNRTCNPSIVYSAAKLHSLFTDQQHGLHPNSHYLGLELENILFLIYVPLTFYGGRY